MIAEGCCAFVSAGLYCAHARDAAVHLGLALFVALDNDAQAGSACAKGMRRWMLSSFFAPTGWMFMTKPFLAPESTLGRGVTVLGGCLVVFGAVLFLYGASSLATAAGLFRDAKRIARETQP